MELFPEFARWVSLKLCEASRPRQATRERWLQVAQARIQARLYHNPEKGLSQPIPRHREINERLAKKILRDLIGK
jgi:hypothetical protein